MFQKLLLCISICLFPKEFFPQYSLLGQVSPDSGSTNAAPVYTAKGDTAQGAYGPGFSVEKYYTYTNLAARAIYTNSFLLASAYYDSAFIYKVHPDYADLKNYILVNSKSLQFEKNEVAIRLLMADKKMDTTFLFSTLPKRVFSANNLLSINKWQRKLYKNRLIENNIQRVIGRLFARYKDALDYNDHVGYRVDSMRLLARRRDSLLQVNLTQFLALYEEEGFPTEEKLGVFYSKDQLWSTMVDLLLQNFIRSEEQLQIVAILETQLHLGNIHPARYAALLDYLYANSKQPVKTNNFMNTTVILLQGEAYRPLIYYSDSLMRVVNRNRRAIGLDSFQVVQRQVIAQHFCHYASVDSTIIPMAMYPKMDIYPYGFVKAAMEKEKQHLTDWKINTAKILRECGCREKTY